MARDHSPCETSCKYIDAVISVLNDCECAYNTQDIQDSIRRLERVREINDELRDWGNDLHHQVEALEGGE